MPYLLAAAPTSPNSWVNMETESVLSGHSERSQARSRAHSNLNSNLNSKMGRVSNNYTSSHNLPLGGRSNLSVNSFPTLPPLPSMPPGMSSLSNYSLSRAPGTNLNNSNYYHLGSRLGDRLTGGTGNYHLMDNNPYNTTLSVPLAQGLTTTGYNGARVQMFTEDWADHSTVTGGMSDLGLGDRGPVPGSAGLSGGPGVLPGGWRALCARYSAPLLVSLLSVLAFLSPILMLILPHMDFMNMRYSQLKCEVDCDGLLISFSFKLVILAVGAWAVFCRPPRASLPRIHLFRALLTLLLFVFLLSFWLFYGVRLYEQRRKIQYGDIVKYATSLLDSLLFLHYLALLLLELRHQAGPQFLIKVVRSPDGESRTFPLGKLSIQRAAAHILQQYYTSFPIYNPYLDTIPSKNRKPGSENYKYYDVDGMGNMLSDKANLSRVSSPIYGVSKKELSHNERFYEEAEYERRVRKRRAKLVTATEEAFAHIKRMSADQMKGLISLCGCLTLRVGNHKMKPPDKKKMEEFKKQFQTSNFSANEYMKWKRSGPTSPLDSYEAAQSIFPSIARPLQKYLRVTRQQPRHSMDTILQHLATTIMYDMSPKAFLEKYLVNSPVLQSEQEAVPVQSWSLICDLLLSRGLEAGLVFQLRQGEVLLLCEVIPLPHFSISEQILNFNHDKFILKPHPESPV